MKLCKLCKKEEQLKLSHIFSRFIVMWLRETGTGKFRNPELPNKREQDGPKEYLLCLKCENLFGVRENYFRNVVFFPYLEKECRFFKSTEELNYFVVSILWRILVTEIEYLRQHKLYNKLVEAELLWRSYLYESSKLVKFNRFHILFTPNKQLEEYDTIPNFNRYITRDLDGTVVSNESTTFVYAKFSRFILIGEIDNEIEFEPLFSGTQLIMDENISANHQSIIFIEFIEFLKNRVELGNRLYDSNLSTPQEKKIIESINRQKRKIANSDYMRAIRKYINN